MSKQIRGKLKRLFQDSPMGGFQIPLSTLKGLTPEEHCSINKGEFSSPSVGVDRCITARGKVFANDNPNTPRAGFSYYYEVLKGIELTPKTDAVLPTRDRIIIGVGEGITINSNVPVLWEVESSLITPNIIKTNEYSSSIHLTALDRAGAFSVKAKNDYDEKEIEITIITPVSLQFEIVKKIHTKDVLDSGFTANIYVLPLTVNFSAITVYELESYAIADGLLSEGNGMGHGKYTNGRSAPIKSLNYVKGKGTKLDAVDLVYGGQNEYPTPLPFDYASESKFEIEFEWMVSDSLVKFPMSVFQSTLITIDGYVVTRKDDQSVKFYYHDPSVNTNLIGAPRIPKHFPK